MVEGRGPSQGEMRVLDRPAIGELLLLVIAVMRHYEAEGCDCTAELRRKYGAA